MNSDRIRQMFGSYSVDVLRQQEDLRIANLCSKHGTRTICRTLAVTLFAPTLPDALQRADQMIREGSSIGETLRQQGFVTHKADTHWCTVTAGEPFASITQQEVAAGSRLAARVYTLLVEHEGDCWEYATIAEAYHPEHEAIHMDSQRCEDADTIPERQRAALDELLRAL